MQSKTILYACALLFAAFALSVSPSEMSDADTAYDVDYGQFYSYTLQFVFNGESAQSIEWDFGDGTPKSTEWNPEHTFANKGTFYVTQTTKNSYNTESITVQVYKVQIMGFPVIFFESNGGSSVQSIQMDSYKGIAVKPADPTKAGLSFAGWFTDTGLTTPYDWTSQVTSSLTLYAKWNSASSPITYSVGFMTDGGSSVPSQIIETGHKAVMPSAPTRSGYTFGGWFTDTACTQAFDFETPVTHDLTLYSKWTANPIPQTTFSVTFDSDGGSQIPGQTVVSGNKAMKPTDPTRSGYSFAGWFIGDVQFDFDTAIVQNTVLKAKWNITPTPVVTKYTVSFDTDGGTPITSQSVESGNKATEPTAPTKEGYTFGGWFLDPVSGTAFSFETPIKSDITLKAKWTATEPSDEEIADAFQQLKEAIGDLFREPIVWILVVIIVLCIVFLKHATRRY